MSILVDAVELDKEVYEKAWQSYHNKTVEIDSLDSFINSLKTYESIKTLEDVLKLYEGYQQAKYKSWCDAQS